VGERKLVEGEMEKVRVFSPVKCREGKITIRKQKINFWGKEKSHPIAGWKRGLKRSHTIK